MLSRSLYPIHTPPPAPAAVGKRKLPRLPRRWKKQSASALLASLALTATLASNTAADDVHWLGGSGSGNYWDIGANWLNGHVPGDGDNAINDSANNLYYRDSGTALSVNSFLNSLSAAFYMTGGTLTVHNNFTNSGSGNINVQNGTLNIGADFVNSGTGNLNISGGALNIGGNLLNSGSGLLNFTGGVTSITGSLNSTSSGAITVSGYGTQVNIGGDFSANGSVGISNGGILSGSGANNYAATAGTTLSSNGTLSGFHLDAATSPITLNSGVLQNSDVTNSKLLNFDSQNNRLDNVALHGGLNLVNTGAAHLVNGTTFDMGDVITIGSSYFSNFSGGGMLSIDQNMALNHNEIRFGNSYYGAYPYNSFGNLLVIDGNHTLTVDAGSTIHGGPFVIRGNYFTGGSSTLDNSGKISYDTPSGYYGYTYAAPTIGGNGLDTIINRNGGIIENNVSGSYSQSLYLNGSLTNKAGGLIQSVATNNYAYTYANLTSLDNAGTIQAVTNSSGYQSYLYLNPTSYVNIGNIKADGTYSYLYLQGGSASGGFAMGAGDSLSADHGGTILLQTTLNNTGNTLDAAAITHAGAGNFVMDGGTIAGGDLNNPSAISFANADNRLQDVAIHGDLNLNNSSYYYGMAHIVGTTTFDPGAHINIDYYNRLLLDGDGTLNSNGTSNRNLNNIDIKFGSNNPYGNQIYLEGNTTLNLGSNALVHGYYGTLGGKYYNGAANAINNAGTIASDVYNSYISVNTDALTNSGILEASNSYSRLYGSLGSLTNSGTIQANGYGSYVNLSDSGAILNSGTVEASGYGSNLYLNGNSLDNSGLIHAAGDYSSVSLSANTYSHLGSVLANGSFSNLYLNGSGSIALGAGDSMKAGTNSTIWLGATLDLTGTTPGTATTFDPTSVQYAGGGAGSFGVQGGRILGGSVTNSNLIRLANGTDNRFDGVALDNNLDLSGGGWAHITNTTGTATTFGNHNFFINNNALLAFDGNKTLDGYTVNFGNSGSYNRLTAEGNGVLTLDAATTVKADGGYGYLGGTGNSVYYYGGQGYTAGKNTIVNNGLIQAGGVNGYGYLYVNPYTLTNNTTIQAESGGQVYLRPTEYTRIGNIVAEGNNSFVALEGGLGGTTNGISLDGSNTLTTHDTGTIYISTLLDNTGKTFNANHDGTGTVLGTGNYFIGGPNGGGTIQNGNVVNSDQLRFRYGRYNTLDGVTLDKNLDLTNGGWARVINNPANINGTTFNSSLLPGNALNFALDSGGVLAFGNTATDVTTFANTHVLFGGNYYPNYDYYNNLEAVNGSTLNIGADSDVTGRYGYIGSRQYNGGTNTINNAGLISVNVNNGNFVVNPYTLTNTGTIEVNSANSSLQTYGNTFTNTGIVQASGSGSNLSINESRFDNGDGITQGQVYAKNSASVYVQPSSLGILGTMNADGAGSALYLGRGSVTDVVYFGQGEHLSATNGGSFYLRQMLDLQGGSFDPASIAGSGATAGTFYIGPTGGIRNGSLLNVNALRFATSGDNRLDNISSLDAGLNLSNGGYAHIMGNTNLTAFPTNATFLIDNNGVLALEGDTATNTRTFANANVIFGEHGTNNRLTAEGYSTLILDPTLNVSGKYGVIGGTLYGYYGPGQVYSNGVNTVINNTTLSSEVAGGSWVLDPYHLTNNAVMQARNGASLSLVTYPDNASAFLNNGTVTSDGAGSSVGLTGYRLTNSAGGVMQAINGGSLSLNPYTYDRLGTVTSDGAGSKVYLGSYSGYGLTLNPATDVLTASNQGAFYLTTTLHNDGTTFDPQTITGVGPMAGKFYVAGGEISNGNLVHSGSLGFTYGQNNRLTNVNVDGGLDLTNGGWAHIQGTTNFGTNLTFSLNNNAVLAFDNNYTLDNNTVNFGDTGQNRLTAEGNSTLTLGSNLSLVGKNGVIGGNIYGYGPGQVFSGGFNTVINNGLISANQSGGSWYVNPYYLTNNATIEARNGANLTLTTYPYNDSSTFNNNGTVQADGAGSSVTLNNYRLTNAGTIKATNGASLTLNPYRYLQLGTVLADGAGSAVYVGGYNGLTLAAGDDNIKATNGGTLYFQTAVNNAGHTFALDNTGSYLLYNGSITGGSITNSQRLGAANYNYYNSLTNVTLDNGVSVSGGMLHVTGSTTFGSGAAINLDNNGYLITDGDRTLTGATVTFGSNPAAGDNRFILEGSSALTLDSSTLVHGKYGSIGSQYYYGGSNTINNQGTISADVAGGNLTVYTQNLNNSGTLEAKNGAILYVRNGNGSLNNSGNINVGAGSEVNIYPYGIRQSGGSTNVDGLLQLYGYTHTLNGGSLSGSGTVAGYVVNNSGSVDLGNHAQTLTIAYNYTQNSGGLLSLLLGNTPAASSFLQINGYASLDGTLNLNLSNDFAGDLGDTYNLLAANGGHAGSLFSNLTSNQPGLGYELAWVGNTLEATVISAPNGEYYLATADGTFHNGANWSTGHAPLPTDNTVNNTTITLTHDSGNDTIKSFRSKAEFDLTGGVLALNGGVAGQQGSFQVNNTTKIDGGILKDAVVKAGMANGNTYGLTFTQNANNGLDNVKFSNLDLNLNNGGYVQVYNGINLNGNAIDLNNGARVGFNGNQTLSNAIINFGANGTNTLSAEGNQTLTLGSGLVLNGNVINLTSNVLAGTGATLDNATNLTADGSGHVINITPYKFINDGTLTAQNNGLININAANYGHIGHVNAYNYGIVNLLGGAIQFNGATDAFAVSGGGQINLKTTLDLTGGAIDGNQINALTLDGATISNGTINNSNALHFTASNNNILNNITLNGGLDLTQGGHVTFSGGLSQGPGAINLDNQAKAFFVGNQTVHDLNVHFGDIYNENYLGTTPANWNLMSVEGGGTLHLGNNIALTGSHAYLTSDTLAATHSTVENDGTFNANSGQNVKIFPDTLHNISGGVMQANAGGILRINPTHMVNEGILQANAGGYLEVGPTNWDKVGVLASNNSGSIVRLTGGPVTFDDYTIGTTHPNLHATDGGQFILSTQVNNANKFFNVVDTGGILTIQNGGFTGGKLNVSSTLLHFAANADNVLDNVTLTKLDSTQLSGLDLSSGGWAHIKHSITSNNLYTLDNGAQLRFDGSRNFGQLDANLNGMIVPGQASTFVVGTGVLNVNDPGSILLFGQGAGITGRNLTINADTLTNRIALTAENSSTWTINAHTLNNTAFAGVPPDIQAGRNSLLTINADTLNNVTSDGLTSSLLESRDNGQLVLNIGNYNRIGQIQSVNNGSRTYINGGGTTGLTLGAQDYLRAYDGGTNVVTTILHNEANTATNGFINLDDITGHVSGGLEFRAGHLIGGKLNTETPYLAFDGYAPNDFHTNYIYGDTLLDNVHLVNYFGDTPAGLDLRNGGWVRIVNAPADTWSNYKFQLDNGAHLTFDGDPVTHTVTFGSSTANAAHVTFGDNPGATGNQIIGYGQANITLNPGTVFTGITHSDGSLGGNYSFNMGSGTLTLNKDTSGGEFPQDAVVDGQYVSFNGGHLINNIALASHVAGGNWNINANTLTNNGALYALNGAAMHVDSGVYDRLGTAVASGFNNSGGAAYDPNNRGQHSQLYLAGNFNLQPSATGDTVLAIGGADIYLGYGNIYTPGGYLNNTGKFLNLEDAASSGRISVGGNGNFIMNGGHIEGGDINSTSSHLKFNNVYSDYPGYYDNTLSNVRLTNASGNALAGLDLTKGGSVSLQNSFTSSSQFALGNYARLTFDNNASNAWNFGADALFDFGTGVGATINPRGTTLTLNGSTLIGTNAVIGDWNIYEPQNRIVNQTILSSNQGGTWIVRPYELDNAGGTIEARGGNGSVMNLQAQHYTNGSIGRVQAIGDNITGDNQAEVVLGGGRIDTTGTLSFEAHGLGKISLQTILNLGGGTLDAAHLGAPISYGNGPDHGGYFELYNGTLENGNLLVDHPANYADQRLTFAPATNNVLRNMTLLDVNNPLNYAGLDLRVGSSVRIEGSFTSNNQFDLDRGAYVSFDGDRTFTDGALNVGSNYSNYGAYGGNFSVDGTLTLGGSFAVNGKWVNLHGGNLVNNIALVSQTPGGSWNVNASNSLTNNNEIAATNGSNMNVNVGGTLTNNGTMAASGGSYLGVSAGSLNNQGTIEALGGSTASVNGGNWAHVGTLLADGVNSVLNLGGTFSMGAGDSIAASNGSKTVLQGTLNLGTQFLSPSLSLADPSNTSQITGRFEVNGGRINNGIVNTNDASLHLINATLDSVTLKNSPTGSLTGLNMTHGENILLLNSLTSNNNFALDNGALLIFGSRSGEWHYGNDTGNPATITFGNSGGIIDITPGYTLNLAAGTSVSGNNMIFGREFGPYGSGDLINGTTLDANGTNLIISTNKLTNTGLIEARNGGYAIVAAASYGQVGHIVADSGTVDLGHHAFWPYSQGGPMTLQAGDHLEANNGGLLSLQTTLNAGGLQLLTGNAGAVVTASNNGTFLFNGGRLNGDVTNHAILNSTSPALVFSHDIPFPAGYQGQDNVLDNVTLTDSSGTTLAGLDLRNGGWAHIMKNITFNNVVRMDNDAHLVLDGDRTYGGAGLPGTFDFGTGAGGTIYFTGGSLVTFNDGGVMNGFTLTGKNANIGAASPFAGGITTLINNNNTTVGSTQGGTWAIVPSVLENDGTLLADNHSTLTLGASGTQIVNNNIITAKNGSALNFNAASMLNNGSISVDSSILTLNNDELTSALGNTISINNSNVVLNNSTLTTKGQLDFTGNSSLVLNQSTFNNNGHATNDLLHGYPVSVANLTINGSTINNGHLTVTGNATIAANTNNYINNADFKLTGNNGLLDMTQGGFLRINNGIITAPKVDLDYGGTLDFSGTPVSNLGTVHFGPHGNNGLYLEGGTTLVFGTGTVLTGNIGTIGDSIDPSTGNRTLVNQGTINPDGPGVNTQIKPTSFDNQGHLHLSNGANANVQSQNFQNEGAIVIDAGSNITIQHGLTQGTGFTTVNGQLTLAPNTELLIKGGQVKGSGLIGGDIDLSGGSIDPGNSPGHLSVTGNLFMHSGAALDIEIAGVRVPGTDFDLLTLGGEADLAGDLNFSFYGGFDPTGLGSTSLTFLTAQHGVHGMFDHINFTGLSGFDYSVVYDANSVVLDLTPQGPGGGGGGTPNVPEPGPIALLISGAASAGWLLRRRRAA